MKIFQILLKALKWGAVSVLGLVVFVLVIVLLFGKFSDPIPEQSNSVVTSESKTEIKTTAQAQTKVETQQLPAYLAQKDFKFLCSTKTDDGHEVDYFESNTKSLGTHLVFRQGITDVGISISKVTSVGGWSLESLCGKNSFDLGDSKWQLLVPGKDCGIGATIEPCDLDSVGDKNGMTEIIFGPEINGYVSKTTADYLKKGALIKISGLRR